ncbi:hypothetical protein R6Q59_015886 [Mikania micrantha]
MNNINYHFLTGESVNDSIAVVESEKLFDQGRYLLYNGGGDRFYTISGQDEEGKDFRFYFDFEHLKESASVLDQDQFWLDCVTFL